MNKCKECEWFGKKFGICNIFPLELTGEEQLNCEAFKYTYEIWYGMPWKEWQSAENYFNCLFAETGLDRKLNNDGAIEIKEWEEWENEYLMNYDIHIQVGEIIIEHRPLQPMNKEELENQYLQFIQSQSDNFFRKLKEQRKILFSNHLIVFPLIRK